MNRQQKEGLIDTLKQEFAQSSAAYLVQYKGLPVSALHQLRRALRAKGGSFKVAKMRLVKRAVSENPTLKDFAPYLKEQRAVVFARQEPTAVARALYDFSKENEKFEIVAGYFEQEVCDKAAIQFIATLPSREVLLAQLAGTLMAPITSLAIVLNAATKQLEAAQEPVAAKE